MPALELFLQAVSGHIQASAVHAPNAVLSRLDFYDGQPLRSDGLCLVSAEDAPALLRQAPALCRATVFVCGAAEQALQLPYGNVVVTDLPLLRLFSLLNQVLLQARQQEHIDDLFRMAKAGAYSSNRLIRLLSDVLDVGIFLLNPSHQLIDGSFSTSANNRFSQKLAADGFLSTGAVRELLQTGPEADGDVEHYFFSGQNCRIHEFNVLLTYHRSRVPDPRSFCETLARAVQAEWLRDKDNAPFFLINETLNKILGGTVTDPSFINAFFSTKSEEPHCYQIVVLNAGNVARCNSWYEWAARLLEKAFRNVISTVYNNLVYAIVVMPAGKNNRFNLRRINWFDQGFREDWSTERFEESLSANDSYACFSTPVFTLRNIPILARLIPEVMEINRKMEAPHCPRILNYERCTPELVTKYCLESFFDTYGPDALRMITYPEIVTLIRYDLLNNTDLCRILYTYLNCGESAKAAKLLFMHRNTVYNKLTRIEQITGVSIDDLEKRSCYLSALRIYFYCTQYLELDPHQLFMPRSE